MQKSFVLSLIFVLVLASCGSSASTSVSTPIPSITATFVVTPTLLPTPTITTSPTPMYYWSHSLLTFTDMVIVPNSGTWIVGQRGVVVQNCMYEVSMECRYKNTIYSLDYYGGINGIDFLAPDDGWVIGTPSSISHWDGKKWEIQKSTDENIGLSDIGFANPNEGWVVGSAAYEETDYTLEAIILHWDGSEWQDVSLFEEIGRNDFSLKTIDVVSENNVWAVGDAVLHWDGIKWQEIPIPQYTQELEDVSATSSADVWVAGRGFVLHWDGNSWITTRFDSYVDNILAISPENVWVGGSSLYHWDGKQWNDAHYDEGRGNSIEKMVLAPDENIWALTTAGNIYLIGNLQAEK
jgi:photosystem II stability/assembly factor-like uncharacterized protein